MKLSLTDDQHALVTAVSARDAQTPEQWIVQHALGLAELYADEMRVRIGPRRSPRRDAGATTNPTSAHMMVCPHCRIETRAAKTCDNCERALP